MSRFSEYEGDGDDSFNGNGWAMWEKRAELALAGRRGRKALVELREALLALPEKRLISRALCTAGDNRIEKTIGAEPSPALPIYRHQNWEQDKAEIEALVKDQGVGVCATGAYVWYQKVKTGMNPQQAFDELPTIPDSESFSEHETARVGEQHGLTYTLAWELARTNDEQFKDLTPEQRFVSFLAWIDRQLAKPPLRRAAPKAKLRVVRKAARAAVRVQADKSAGQITLPL